MRGLYFMDINEIRKEVYDAYPGDKWHAKVKKMGKSQLYAIYCNLEAKKQKLENSPPDEKEIEKFHQMDIFEYLKGND